ncbi:MAG: UxaA family hydrolase [Pirellulales bacterium]
MSTSPAARILHLHPDDNVGVAIRDLDPGPETTSEGRAVRLMRGVRLGHKIALTRIPEGHPILKYGQPIGVAIQTIEPGEWVHGHNLTAGPRRHDYEYATEIPPAPTPIVGRTFAGFRRADGKVGTRNYVAILSTVNCSATVCRRIAAHFDRSILKDFPNIDGVIALTHKGGCSMQYGGEDHQQLNRVLAGYARHPNVAAYLLVGLGCEVATLSSLVESGGLVRIESGTARPPAMLSMQDCGGTAKTIEAGIKLMASILPKANDVRRQQVPAGELVLGTNCGGSDGNSGITANPALGLASDRVVAAGGTSILAETTEVYGAEHLLTRRAVSREVGEKLIERIRWWERYTAMFGVEIDNNPSPGNKEGGLTTIYEKSLGAIAKGGSTALTEVYRYAEPVTAKGLVLMDTPGNDAASVTGIVAGGANLVAFTSGRGSCYGCMPAPSIKIATNTPMYERMIDDMDLDAGVILDGTPPAEVGRQIFELILEVAGGKRTKSELLGIGEEEFAPWAIGPTL